MWSPTLQGHVLIQGFSEATIIEICLKVTT